MNIIKNVALAALLASGSYASNDVPSGVERTSLGEKVAFVRVKGRKACSVLTPRGQFCSKYADLSSLPAYQDVPDNLCVFDDIKGKYVSNTADSAPLGCHIPGVDPIEMAKLRSSELKSRMEERLAAVKEYTEAAKEKRTQKRAEVKEKASQVASGVKDEIQQTIGEMKTKQEERKTRLKSKLNAGSQPS